MQAIDHSEGSKRRGESVRIKAKYVQRRWIAGLNAWILEFRSPAMLYTWLTRSTKCAEYEVGTEGTLVGRVKGYRTHQGEEQCQLSCVTFLQ